VPTTMGWQWDLQANCHRSQSLFYSLDFESMSSPWMHKACVAVDVIDSRFIRISRLRWRSNTWRLMKAKCVSRLFFGQVEVVTLMDHRSAFWTCKGSEKHRLEGRCVIHLSPSSTLPVCGHGYETVGSPIPTSPRSHEASHLILARNHLPDL
jgi:hypothetical protein